LLHQHIDELTEDKLGLQRGLAKQQQVAQDLADENEALTRQYNAQARVVEELNKKVCKLISTTSLQLYMCGATIGVWQSVDSANTSIIDQ
jgi:hypothetical protein